MNKLFTVRLATVQNVNKIARNLALLSLYVLYNTKNSARKRLVDHPFPRLPLRRARLNAEECRAHPGSVFAQDVSVHDTDAAMSDDVGGRA